MMEISRGHDLKSGPTPSFIQSKDNIEISNKTPRSSGGDGAGNGTPKDPSLVEVTMTMNNQDGERNPLHGGGDGQSEMMGRGIEMNNRNGGGSFSQSPDGAVLMD